MRKGKEHEKENGKQQRHRLKRQNRTQKNSGQKRRIERELRRKETRKGR